MGIEIVVNGKKEHEKEWLKDFSNYFKARRIGISSKIDITGEFSNIRYNGNNQEFIFLDGNNRPVAWIQAYELWLLYEFYLWQEFGDEYFIMDEEE